MDCNGAQFNVLRGYRGASFLSCDMETCSSKHIFVFVFRSGHETVAVLLPGFAINW